MNSDLPVTFLRRILDGLKNVYDCQCLSKRAGNDERKHRKEIKGVTLFFSFGMNECKTLSCHFDSAKQDK